MKRRSEYSYQEAALEDIRGTETPHSKRRKRTVFPRIILCPLPIGLEAGSSMQGASNIHANSLPVLRGFQKATSQATLFYYKEMDEREPGVQ